MTDQVLGSMLLTAVLFAGAIRAYTDKNIAIFYLSFVVVAILASGMVLYEADLLSPAVKWVFFGLLVLAGTTLEAFVGPKNRELISSTKQ